MAHTKTHYTLYEALELLDTPAPRDGSSNDMDYGNNWFGCDNLKQAANMARHGNIETLNLLDQEARKLSTSSDNVIDAALETTFDCTGHTVDIARYLEGEPECMLETSITSSNRVVNILVHINCSCYITSQDLARRLAITASIIRALEIAGYSVGITCHFSSIYNKEHTHDIQVKIKNPDNYADWSVIAFWLAHPSALRRCMLRLAENEPDDIRSVYNYKIGGGYGSININYWNTNKVPDTVYIPAMSPSDAKKDHKELQLQIKDYFAEQKIFVDFGN